MTSLLQNDWLELDRLIDGACDWTLSAHDWQNLSQWLIDSPDARTRYLEAIDIHGNLAWQLMPKTSLSPAELRQYTQAEINLLAIDDNVCPPPSRPLLANVFHNTTAYFSSGWPLAYLIATVLLTLSLLAASLFHISTPNQQLATGHSPLVTPSNPQSPFPNPSAVARVTGLVDCEFAPNSAVTFAGAHISIGRKLSLASGLLELTYVAGAKVILQGPCDYEVTAPAAGYLSIGKLTARVEKKVAGGQWPVASKGERGEGSVRTIRNQKSLAPSPSPLATNSNPQIPKSPNPLFSVSTPSATVTDLGTEFGVEVKTDGAVACEVFQGLVELKDARPEAASTMPALLTKGQYAKVEPNKHGVARVDSMPNTFVRQLPNNRRIEQTLIYSSGKPNTTVWKYSMSQPAGDWMASDFDDSSWIIGRAAFGDASNQPTAAQIATNWDSFSIWLRTEVHLDEPASFRTACLELCYGKYVEVYVNGRKIFTEAAHRDGYESFDVSRQLRAALRKGRNVFAVRADNIGSVRVFDMGLSLDAQKTMLSGPVYKRVVLLESASLGEPPSWRWIAKRPSEQWNTPAFDDSTWSEGQGGFGSIEKRDVPAKLIGTPWTSNELWLRKTIQLPETSKLGSIALYLTNIGNVEIFLNGSLLATASKDAQKTKILAVTREFKGLAVENGLNVIAVHIKRKAKNDQYLDVGFTSSVKTP